ncbi:hypothetical protein [Nocardioides convexus]|uniref:hypothetical protein n=1 Tax=Nocardioides convexus TaxID=2712224 RepID=UPI0024182A6A|nr:hypothetical protein [Nocardioides convexus]
MALPEALGFSATPREAPVPGPPDLHVVPDPDRAAKARAAAEERLAAADEEHEAARETYDEAVGEVDRLEARQAPGPGRGRRACAAAWPTWRSRPRGWRRSSPRRRRSVTAPPRSLRTATAERDAAQAAVDRLG